MSEPIKLKVPYERFVAIAMKILSEEYKIKEGNTPLFMKRTNYDGDMECYEKPDYVEIELSHE